MKVVLYTQRVDIIKSYGERRDCADQRIAQFLAECGYLPLALPNIMLAAEQMINELKPAGIVFTGGNSLSSYGGDAPERDALEKEILGIALKKDIPIYGFCRGMQVILDYFGCKLEAVTGHAAVHHQIHGELGNMSVNSYHNFGCKRIKEPLRILAKADDGVIEAVCHIEKRIAAVMWHPERENSFSDTEKKRLQELFKL